jgi:rare lipoprotein A
MAFLAGVMAGCGHHKTSSAPQTAPPIETEQAEADTGGAGSAAADVPRTRTPQASRIPITPVPPGGITAEDIRYVNTHPPIGTEVGLATWYSAPYKGRKAANGEVFEDYALTAAHRTLPMGSLIVVTNLKTGQ